MKERFIKVLKTLPKMRYRIVEILGDYYYEDMPFEEAFKSAF
jgi:hypothetical protein